MTESALQRKIIKDLEGRGCYIIKTIVTNRQGRADLIICHQGRFIALEIKKEDGKETDLQRVNRDQVKKSGGIAGVVYTWEQYLEIKKMWGL